MHNTVLGYNEYKRLNPNKGGYYHWRLCHFDNDSIYKMASCEMGEVSETAVPTYLTNLYPTDHDDRILFLKLFSLNTSEFWQLKYLFVNHAHTNKNVHYITLTMETVQFPVVSTLYLIMIMYSYYGKLLL